MQGRLECLLLLDVEQRALVLAMSWLQAWRMVVKCASSCLIMVKCGDILCLPHSRSHIESNAIFSRYDGVISIHMRFGVTVIFLLNEEVP